MNTAPLDGRTAFVTGSDRGIGKAIAIAFSRAGARVALHGLANRDEADALMREMAEAGAPEACFFGGNLLDPTAVTHLTEEVFAWRPVDILVNNAGIQRTGPLAEIADATWDDVLAINLSAPFRIMRRLLPAMAATGYGRVINIASVHGLVASIHKAPYVAAKFGLVGLSRVAALEHATAGDAASGGVTVNCICPGWVDTPILEPQIAERARMLDVPRAEAILSMLADKQPSRRLSSPEEIARLVLWLCAQEAHNLTGAAIPVDGGWTAQ